MGRMLPSGAPRSWSLIGSTVSSRVASLMSPLDQNGSSVVLCCKTANCIPLYRWPTLSRGQEDLPSPTARHPVAGMEHTCEITAPPGAEKSMCLLMRSLNSNAGRGRTPAAADGQKRSFPRSWPASFQTDPGGAFFAGGGADLGDHPEQLLQRKDGGIKSVTGPAAPELVGPVLLLAVRSKGSLCRVVSGTAGTRGRGCRRWASRSRR
jgi:hypothetical protein